MSAQQQTDAEPWDSLALVFPAEAPLWLVPFLGEDKAQLLVSGESSERAIHTLAGLRSIPVVLSAEVDPVATGCAFIVVPSGRAFP